MRVHQLKDFFLVLTPNQGTLTEGEGSVRLTTKLR